MVDKCLQGPPQSGISVQHLCSSIQPKISQGQNIEVQLNSKGDPPEESTPQNSIKPEIQKVHQPMSLNAEYKPEGCTMGERDFGKPSIAEEVIVKNVETDEILNEEEVKSMSSGVSGSGAEALFHDLNVGVQKYNNFPGYDDDPPYYQPNTAPRRKHALECKRRRPQKIPRRVSPSVAKVRGGRIGAGTIECTSDSNSDSYRSVIDDLTIKNQKLKKRLKRLEELHAGHLQTDKVLELRIHGLTPAKRQELENILQQFTSTLQGSPSSSGPSLTESPPTTSTESSFIPSIDSAYASNMGSGAASRTATSSKLPSLSSSKSGQSRQSRGSWNAVSSGKGTASSGCGGINGKKVPTYISERAKMKLVVRGLEYLFTGKQPQDQHFGRNPQQSSVPPDTDGTAEVLEGQEGKPTEKVDRSPARSPEPDNRLPQIPDKNVEYLQQFTASPTHQPLVRGGHWNGWIYLNLVIGLAQLHTINVTVPFVKKAITTMSSRLELSPDGKMVRLKNAVDGTTNLPNENDTKGDTNNSPSSCSPVNANSESPRGRKRCDGSYSADLSSLPGMQVDIPERQESLSTRVSTLSRSYESGDRSTTSPQRSSEFHYRPLFARSKDFDDGSSEPSETGYSSSSAMKSTSSPDGLTGSGDYTGVSRAKGKRQQVGPIIYYENGKFCTDLSSQEVTSRDESTTLEYPYERMTNEVVGAPGRTNLDTSDENSRPLLKSPTLLDTLVEDQLLGNNPRGASGSADEDGADDSDGLDFSPKFEPTSPGDPPLPVELEASGLGGVQPDDNFAINVQVKHYIFSKGRNAQTLNSRKMRAKLHAITHRIPRSSIDVFLKDEVGAGILPTTRPRSRSASSSPSPPRSSSSDGRSPKPLSPELVAESLIRLAPSSLPPPSYMCFSPSSDESRSDSDSALNTSSHSDSFSEFQVNDAFNYESQDIRRHTYSSRSGSRGTYMEELSPSGSFTSGGSSNLVIAPVRPPGSSAATAGSRCESMDGVDAENDDPSDGDGRYKNDSDEAMDDLGPDYET